MNLEQIEINYSQTQKIKETLPEKVNINKNKLVKLLEKVVKRLIDIIGALLGLITLIPLTIGIYIARKILKEDKGPIFYDQLRIGKNGKNFKLYKFRTMVIDADKILEKYLQENEEARIEFEENKKLKNDPRITKLGNFLRKTSLDEFPQFINVLKGEMSLVGPRPYLLREKEEMSKYYEDIIKCKPGITGLWQVSGRNHTTFDERLQMDIEYLHNEGLKIDVKILKQTVKQVIKQEGAM